MAKNIYVRNTTPKSVRFENDLIEKIEQMGAEAERDFSSQVRYMVKEYIRIKESK